MILMKVLISMISKLISNDRDERKESLRELFVIHRLEDQGLRLMTVMMTVMMMMMVMMMMVMMMTPSSTVEGFRRDQRRNSFFFLTFFFVCQRWF
jgi:type IV secretory pathway component VirB8